MKRRKYNPLRVRLENGGSVVLDALFIERTAAGFLEGHPFTISQEVKIRLPARITERTNGLPFVVINPPNTVLNLGQCVICGHLTENWQLDSFDFDPDSDWGKLDMKFLVCNSHEMDNKTIDKIGKTLFASGAAQPLPEWLCFGRFKSYVDGGIEELGIGWFADSIDMNLGQLVEENIRNVDWNDNAKSISYDDF